MLTKNFLYLIAIISIVGFLIFIYIRKKKNLNTVYILLFIIIFTAIIANIFFPMPIQKEVIIDKNYTIQPQTFELFSEIKKLLSFSLEKTVLEKVLKSHFFTSIFPIISFGIAFGFLLRMKIKSLKVFIFYNLSFTVLAQIIKWIVCIILNAQYIAVIPDNSIYFLIGSFSGNFILFVIRKIILKINYNSKTGKNIKQFILEHSKYSMN